MIDYNYSLIPRGCPPHPLGNIIWASKMCLNALRQKDVNPHIGDLDSQDDGTRVRQHLLESILRPLAFDFRGGYGRSNGTVLSEGNIPRIENMEVFYGTRL